ncbi:MAG: hypothetical protein IJC72_00560, partial [Clostridia bacterium]|nr:hypothetical protein [Clostridia bacterium]
MFQTQADDWLIPVMQKRKGVMHILATTVLEVGLGGCVHHTVLAERRLIAYRTMDIIIINNLLTM